MHSDVRYLLASYGTQRLWHAGGRDQEVAAFPIHFPQICSLRGFMLSYQNSRIPGIKISDFHTDSVFMQLFSHSAVIYCFTFISMS